MFIFLRHLEYDVLKLMTVRASFAEADTTSFRLCGEAFPEAMVLAVMSSSANPFIR
jgi:hypothetical protein